MAKWVTVSIYFASNLHCVWGQIFLKKKNLYASQLIVTLQFFVWFNYDYDGWIEYDARNMPKGIIAILLYNRQLYLLICNKKSIFDKNN